MYYILFSLLFLSLYVFYSAIAIYIIDYFSGLLAILYLKLNPKRYKISKNNIEMVFPKITPEKLENIIYYSTKLFFINIFMFMHQRFVIDRNIFLHKFKKTTYNLPKEKKAIFTSAHYGIYWHPVIFKKLFGNVSFFYKNNFKILDMLFIPVKKMNEFNVYPYKPNQMSLLKKNKHLQNILIVCDHYYKKSNPVKFLNQTYNIYNSPAILHKGMKVPLYVYFTKYDFRSKEFIQKIVPIKTELDESVDSIAQKIADAFSEEIIKNPEQYLWSQLHFKKYSKTNNITNN